MEVKEVLSNEYNNQKLISMAIYKLSKNNNVITQRVSNFVKFKYDRLFQDLENTRDWLNNIKIRDLYDTKKI